MLRAASGRRPSPLGHRQALCRDCAGAWWRFAETMFIGGGSYDIDTAVEQLTLLWANSLGITETAASH